MFILPCSEIVKELEENYNKGAFICCNDHMITHETVSHKIFDDNDFNEANFKDHEDTIEKFRQNLIHNMKNKVLIKDPLKFGGVNVDPL